MNNSFYQLGFWWAKCGFTLESAGKLNLSAPDKIDFDSGYAVALEPQRD